MSIKTRIQKIEEKTGINSKHKYILAFGPEIPERFKIQSYSLEFGGTGGEDFFLETWEEVEEFNNRPDVALTIIVVGIDDDERFKGLRTIEPTAEMEDL